MKDTNEKTEPLFFTDTNCKLLFDNMQSGVAYHEMIFENGKPVDFIFIAVNKAFEETIGLTNVEGKKGSELVPRIQESDPELFDICGRVAESGKPERIEYHIKALNRWYTSSLYSPKKGYFVSISEDITERKQAEKFVRKMQRQQKSILDNIPDIDNLFPKKTQEEVQTALDGFIESLSNNGEEEANTYTSPPKTNKTLDVVSAFNELTGN